MNPSSTEIEIFQENLFYTTIADALLQYLARPLPTMLQIEI